MMPFCITTKLKLLQHQKYKIRNYLIYPAFKPIDLNGDQQEQKLDTLIDEDYRFVYPGRLKYRPIVFHNLNRMKDSTWYCLQNAEKNLSGVEPLKTIQADQY